MTGYIYKITNDINDKVYIGLCTTSIEERFATHIKDSKRRSYEQRPLYAAMRKYGSEHFHVVQIEECDLDHLGEREQYWIAYYNSYHYGYNATLGGEGRPLYDYEAISNRLKECPYSSIVAQEFNCCPDTIRTVAKKNNIKLKQHTGETRKLQTQKTVQALDKNTNEIVAEFESTVKAAEWCFENGYCSSLNSGVRSHISEVANGKRPTSYGFKWKYKE